MDHQEDFRADIAVRNAEDALSQASTQRAHQSGNPGMRLFRDPRAAGGNGGRFFLVLLAIVAFVVLTQLM